MKPCWKDSYSLGILGVLMSISGLSAQCSLSVELGDDIEVCSKDREVQLFASVDGEVLNFSWSDPETIDNPSSLQPRTVAAPMDEISYHIDVQGYHPDDNLLQNPSFEDGDVGFSSEYETGSNVQGGYIIDTIATALFADAEPCKDHTGGNGNMMMVKVSQSQEVPIWCQEVSVDPNRSYHFRGAAMGLRNNFPPVLVIKINDQTISSGTLESSVCDWQEIQGDWSASGSSTAKICIHVSPEDIGNETDFALDDLGFFEVCTVSDDLHFQSYPIQVGGDKLIELPCGGEHELIPTLIGPQDDFLYIWRTRGGNFQSDVHVANVLIDRAGYYELNIGWTDGNLICFDTLRVDVQSTLDESIDIEQIQSGTCDLPEILLESINVPNVDNLKYEWRALEGMTSGDTASPDILVDAAGRFELTVTDTVRRCSTIRVESVALDLLPSPSVEILSFACDSRLRDIQFTAPLGAYMYSIDTLPFQSDKIFLDVEPGSRVVRVQDEGGCIGQETIYVEAPRSIEIVAPNRILVEGGQGQLPVTVNLGQDSLRSITWSPTDQLTCVDCISPTILLEDATELTLIVEDINSCRDTVIISVIPVSDTPIFVPNAFTPNGDGINDELVFAANESVERFAEIQIFDRWGNLVYSENELLPGSTWSGLVDGRTLPTASYIYTVVVQLRNAKRKRFSGTFGLIR